MGLEPVGGGGGGNGRNVYVSDEKPENPSDGDEWVNTSYNNRPEKRIYSNGTWSILITGINFPPLNDTQYYKDDTREKRTLDVEYITGNATFIIRTEPGEDGDSTSNTGSHLRYSQDADHGENGGGAIAEAVIDCEPYDTLIVKPGSISGNNGQYSEITGRDRRPEAWGGDGGDGTKIIDGKGNTVVEVTGGAGASAARAFWYDSNATGSWEGYEVSAAGGRGGADKLEAPAAGGTSTNAVWDNSTASAQPSDDATAGVIDANGDHSITINRYISNQSDFTDYKVTLLSN